VYKIHPGTPTFARRAGTWAWRQCRAKYHHEFRDAEAKPYGGTYLIFTRDGWEYMILKRHATEGYPLPNKQPSARKAKKPPQLTPAERAHALTDEQMLLLIEQVTAIEEPWRSALEDEFERRNALPDVAEHLQAIARVG
jgi:hypothetical protein